MCRLVDRAASLPPQGRHCFGGVLVPMEVAYWWSRAETALEVHVSGLVD